MARSASLPAGNHFPPVLAGVPVIALIIVGARSGMAQRRFRCV